MSRGLGTQQRRILVELEKRGIYSLMDLQPQTRAEYIALNRAAWKLEEMGKIGITHYWCGANDTGKLLIHPRGAKPDRVKWCQDRWKERKAKMEAFNKNKTEIINVEPIP